MKKNLIVVCSI